MALADPSIRGETSRSSRDLAWQPKDESELSAQFDQHARWFVTLTRGELKRLRIGET